MKKLRVTLDIPIDDGSRISAEDAAFFVKDALERLPMMRAMGVPKDTRIISAKFKEGKISVTREKEL